MQHTTALQKITPSPKLNKKKTHVNYASPTWSIKCETFRSLFHTNRRQLKEISYKTHKHTQKLLCINGKLEMKTVHSMFSLPLSTEVHKSPTQHLHSYIPTRQNHDKFVKQVKYPIFSSLKTYRKVRAECHQMATCFSERYAPLLQVCPKNPRQA